MSVPHTAAERLTEVEVQLLHLQRHVEQLDTVVTELGQQMDRHARLVELLEGQLKDLRAKPQESGPSDPLEDRPPHY